MSDNQKKPNQPNCLKKSNLLVYQQPTGQRTERKDDCRGKVKIPICNPKPKQIKVCTGAELRKMCPPKVCPCPPVKRRKFGMLRFLGFGVKAAVAAAAVYVTYDMGIWGTTDDTQELYSTACALFRPPAPRKNDKWDPPSCEAESDLFNRPKFNPYAHCDEPPIKAQDTYLKFQEYWNCAISCIFSGIAGFPHNIMGGRSEDDKKKLENEGKKCIPFSKLDSEDKQKVENQYK